MKNFKLKLRYVTRSSKRHFGFISRAVCITTYFHALRSRFPRVSVKGKSTGLEGKQEGVSMEKRGKRNIEDKVLASSNFA